MPTPTVASRADGAELGIPGSYQIGRRQVTFTEPGHIGPTGENLGARVLVTDIRYPVALRSDGHAVHGPFPLVLFADPANAAAVLRQVQVLTMTATLASLDYRTADAAHAAIASLIASPTAPRPAPDADDSIPKGIPDAGQDAELVAAASRIVAGAGLAHRSPARRPGPDPGGTGESTGGV
jgi:hypothetical protein